MPSRVIPLKRRKKKVLIVNCFFDEMRFKVGRNTQVPQAMDPVYLAGAYSAETCDVRLYSKMYSGPMEDEKLLAWPDLVVLTGLNTAFDRMLHITAYARTQKDIVIVVAGVPAIRNLSHLSSRYFDYVCLGDIEELQEVVTSALGLDYAAGEMPPRYELAYWMNQYGYVESSRNCNFMCSFCTLTGEGHGYQKYSLDFVRRRIVALGKHKDPIVGTPVFYDCLDQGMILALSKLHDLESTPTCDKPLDPIREVVKFIYDIQTLRDYRRDIIQHSWQFYRRYGSELSPSQMAVALNNAIKNSYQITPNKTMLPKSFRSHKCKRTHLSTTEIFDQVYQPLFRIDSRYARYFQPTYLTDASGALASNLEADTMIASHSLKTGTISNWR